MKKIKITIFGDLKFINWSAPNCLARTYNDLYKAKILSPSPTC